METLRFTTQKELEDARREAEEAAAAYYNSDSLEMDDLTYDQLVKAIEVCETEHPEWRKSGVTDQVAGGVARGGETVHSQKMLSLDNVFDEQSLKTWWDKLDGAEVVVEPKLDGIALTAKWENGKLVSVTTRGDGQSGEDVTDKVGATIGLNQDLKEPKTVEVRGECIMTHEQFEQANVWRAQAGKTPFANPRNAVAGTIRALHVKQRAQTTFVAYTVLGEEETKRHNLDMEHVSQWGLINGCELTATDSSEKTDFQAVWGQIQALNDKRDALGFDIDGAVIKVNDKNRQANLGATSKAPRWAMAYKYPPDTRVTQLLDIEVNVGRTGNLSFTGVLAPVDVCGVTIERATLHNPKEIARKGLYLNDWVWVRRAGDVIPEIVGPKLPRDEQATQQWTPPTTCPNCGGDLDVEETIWKCLSKGKCGQSERMIYAASRGCLDIEGLGETHVRNLVEAGHLNDLSDLYTLNLTTLTSVERIGEKAGQKILNEIEKARQLPLSRQLAAVGIKMTGRRMSKRLAETFKTSQNLFASTVKDLEAIEGIGTIRGEYIHSELVQLKPLFDKLENLGVNLVEPDTSASETGDKPWAGKKVCVTGSIDGLNRTQAQEGVEALGGTTTSSVTKNTSILVAGEKAGSKKAKAEKLGITIINGEEFLQLLGEKS